MIGTVSHSTDEETELMGKFAQGHTASKWWSWNLNLQLEYFLFLIYCIKISVHLKIILTS